MQVFEPSRTKYRKKIKKQKECVFCIKKNFSTQECRNIKGLHWYVIVNKYPYMDGNVMILPKRHVTDITEINSEEWSEFYKILTLTQKVLTKIFNTTSFNIGLNIGEYSGASIDHIHWQIIPRKRKINNATNIFSDLYVITLSPQELKRKIEKIKL